MMSTMHIASLIWRFMYLHYGRENLISSVKMAFLVVLSKIWNEKYDFLLAFLVVLKQNLKLKIWLFNILCKGKSGGLEQCTFEIIRQNFVYWIHGPLHSRRLWQLSSTNNISFQVWRGLWQGNDIVAKILNVRECTVRMSRDFQEEFPRLR